ncbi:SDR family NAD(P)-dependent oxidoreductase, partial [Streptococcus pneumoniae]|uniref:SDR family NAD(P)-dependent oxidoreductase n=1 Tax=Streptococcus pneumoniae TaxID=1313 RepID=UPI0013DCD8F5
NAVRKIEAAGGKAVAEPADLTNAVAVDDVVKRIVARFGRLDILVNNAGVNIQARSWKQIEADGIDTLVHGNL